MGESKKISILGAGSWGTVLSHLLALSGHSINLWSRSDDFVQHTKRIGRFTKPVELNLPEAVNLTSSLQESLIDIDLLICAVPSEAVKTLSQSIKVIESKIPLFLSVTKGLSVGSVKRMSEIWSETIDCDIAALSGPNLSAEAALAKPMKTVIASKNMESAQTIADCFHVPNFKTEITDDIVGVEIAGAAKNVIALIAGAWDGLSLGTSGKGAMLTRAVSELSHLVDLMGGKRETVFSVAGLGDLYITCSSPLSRNYRAGYSLAKGKTLDEVHSELGGQVSEGVYTAPLIKQLSNKYEADLRVCDAANKLIAHDKLSLYQIEEMLVDLV
ncbi:MAG: NAD(P)H-dependent glycerol-3-phosphate dehydrogenase [Candidatus Caenarcaniphilales bacterium]|nr:NAD(P)H-dependent glycerol-3-phosphate dehydrogenase [Candidatus Caenarcaniphilales bacterium]